MKFVMPIAVMLVMIVATNMFPVAYRPPLYGLGFVLWGLALYPIARSQHPVPLARYLANGDQLVLSKYVMLWIAMGVLFMSISGVLLFR